MHSGFNHNNDSSSMMQFPKILINVFTIKFPPPHKKNKQNVIIKGIQNCFTYK